MDQITYVYIIQCKDKSLYTGITNDYKTRWEQHKENKGSKYVRSRKFDKPVFLNKFSNHHEACLEEIRIKKLNKQQKLVLIESEDNIIQKPFKY